MVIGAITRGVRIQGLSFPFILFGKTFFCLSFHRTFQYGDFLKITDRASRGVPVEAPTFDYEGTEGPRIPAFPQQRP